MNNFNFEIDDDFDLSSYLTEEDSPKPTMLKLIDQAKKKHVAPMDIFRKSYKELVDPEKFLDDLTKTMTDKQYYINKLNRRIELCESGSEFYDILFKFVNDLKLDHKLQPATIKQETKMPETGADVAMLCKLLEIQLPVRYPSKR